MLRRQPLETAARQLQWSVQMQWPCQNSHSFPEIPCSLSQTQPTLCFHHVFNRLDPCVSLQGCPMIKAKGTQLLWDQIKGVVLKLQTLSFLHKTSKTTVLWPQGLWKLQIHYAPCLWRNTSASRSKFKETPFKVKWQVKYWSNCFCYIHVHGILISLTFFCFNIKHCWGDLNFVAAMIIQKIPLSGYQIH